MLAKFTYRLNLKFMECDFLSFWWLNATIFYEWGFHTYFSEFYHVTEVIGDTVFGRHHGVKFKIEFRVAENSALKHDPGLLTRTRQTKTCGLCFMSASHQHQLWLLPVWNKLISVTHTLSLIHTHIQTRWIDQSIDRQINRWMDVWMDGQMDRQTNKDRQTDIQIDIK